MVGWDLWMLTILNGFVGSFLICDVALQSHRPNLAAAAEAKDLMAASADQERGARSYPTAKSALRWQNRGKFTTEKACYQETKTAKRYEEIKKSL